MSHSAAHAPTAASQTADASPDAGFCGLTVALAVDDEAWLDTGLGDLDALVLRCLKASATRLALPENLVTEIGATFADDASVKLLNAEWRGIDKPTNVLSFPLVDLEPGDAPGPMLGDVIFARETLLREAAAEGKTLHDHLCHLIVHGFLHCLGFDHIETEDAEAMERLETEILSDLAIADPYAADGLADPVTAAASDTNELTPRR